MMTREEVMKDLEIIADCDDLSVDAKQAIGRLSQNDQAQRAVIDKLKGRLRTTAQLGIEVVGADGPEDAESVVGRMTAKIEQQAKEIKTLRELLRELHALVQGECPSLLNEDSGGDAQLALAIEHALKEVTT